MASQRASAKPALKKPYSPAERLAAQQRDHEKLQRKRQLRSWQRKQEDCLLLSQPLLTLSLGHPHRAGEDGKWVREGCFSD